MPLPSFHHTSHPQDSDTEDYVAIIASGMKLPVDEIRDVYDKFKKQMQKIDLDNDSFFNTKSKMDTTFGTGLDVGSYAKKPTNKNEEGRTKFFSKYGDAKKQTIEVITSAKDEL